MQITVKGKGMDVGDAFRTHVTEALTDHLNRYFDRSLDVHVTVSKQGVSFNVDLALHVPGEILAAHADGENAYAAYDAAAIKLFAQVKKHKSRTRDQKHNGQRDGMAGKAVSA